MGSMGACGGSRFQRRAEENRRTAGGEVGHNLAFYSVYVLNESPSHDLFWRPFRHHPPEVQRHQSVAVRRGEVQVVEDGQNGFLPRDGETADDIEDAHHMPDVEMGRWLIQEEHRRILGEGLGQDHALLLTARELFHGAVGQMLHPQAFRSFPGTLVIASAAPSPWRQVR
jgi:hypothetical protein